MDETKDAKKVEKVEKVDKDALFAKVRHVEEKVDKAIKALERVFGIDIDKDGKVGSVSVWLLAIVSAICMAGAAMATETNETLLQVATEGNDAAISLAADDNDDAADKMMVIMRADGTWGISVGGTDVLSSSGYAASGLTGNIAIARLTNALQSAGPYIGGNIPQAALTNALSTGTLTTNTFVTGPADGVTNVWVFRTIGGVKVVVSQTP